MNYPATRTSDQRSVLAFLRALVPERPLAPREVLMVAQLQANHLLQRFQIDAGAVPEEMIGELPRVRVVREAGLPVSGAAHWNGRYWVISINADEPLVRQRFSLMHEFKHVLDHTTKHNLYYDRPFQSADEQAERVADYFAACVLMPKRVVTRLWCSGHQDLPAFAAKLQVSVPALRYRLAYLGLTEPTKRCERPRRPDFGRVQRPARHFREPVFPATGGVA
jgi:Zn-dependent peptidase ImmA (M78 family)